MPIARSAEAYLNRDLYPVGLFYGLSYWNALFSPGLARPLQVIGRLHLWVLSLPIALLVVLFVAVVTVTGRGGGAVVPTVVAATGFAGMAADLIAIFAFQNLYGYVYQWVVLLITAFMAGLALGGWLTNRRLTGEVRDWWALVGLEVGLVLFWILLPLALSVLYDRLALPWLSISTQVMLFLLNGVAGFLVGAQFPLANQIWLQGREGQRGITGLLYASDLVGAFGAAVMVSVALMPVLGIVGTCALVAILKLGSLALVVLLVPRT